MAGKACKVDVDKAIEKAKDFDFIRFTLCDIQGISR